MALAARDADTCPWQLSFKGALQTLNAFLPMLCTDASLDAWCTAFAACSPRTSSAIALTATNPA